MAIDVFVRRLPRKARNFLDLAQGMVLEIVFIALIVPSFRAMREFTLSSALRIPEKYVFMVIPVTVCLLACHNIIILARMFRRPGSSGEAPVQEVRP
jgi:TRAP-type C4-dicarboxylate transport system permease small subunit